MGPLHYNCKISLDFLHFFRFLLSVLNLVNFKGTRCRKEGVKGRVLKRSSGMDKVEKWRAFIGPFYFKDSSRLELFDFSHFSWHLELDTFLR